MNLFKYLSLLCVVHLTGCSSMELPASYTLISPGLSFSISPEITAPKDAPIDVQLASIRYTAKIQYIQP